MIYPFHSEGVVKDPDYFYVKQLLVERRCIEDMHRNGYAPVLDMVPDVEMTYDEDKDVYWYKVTVYGKKAPSHMNPAEYEGWLMAGVPNAEVHTDKDYKIRKSSGRLIGRKVH